MTGKLEKIMLADKLDFRSKPYQVVNLDLNGIIEDSRHYGNSRSAGKRDKKLFEKGQTIKNTRQISGVSLEELEQIEKSLNIEYLDPSCLGSCLVFSGIEKLSLLPPTTRLEFENGTIIKVDQYNVPCHFPGDCISDHYKNSKLSNEFIKHAKFKRGFLGYVELGGTLRVGESCKIHKPKYITYSIPKLYE